MNISINPAYAHCTKRNCAVSLDQTEGQCREQHNCNGDACPLEKEFGKNTFARSIQALAASIGQGWAVTKT